jgi:hypothetical protein
MHDAASPVRITSATSPHRDADSGGRGWLNGGKWSNVATPEWDRL